VAEALWAYEQDLPVAGIPATYKCVFCGMGTYDRVAVSGTDGHNRGYSNEGMTHREAFVFLECPECGNAQRFKLKFGEKKWFPS
jgi:RNase P subunit RPR2